MKPRYYQPSSREQPEGPSVCPLCGSGNFTEGTNEKLGVNRYKCTGCRRYFEAPYKVRFWGDIRAGGTVLDYLHKGLTAKHAAYESLKQEKVKMSPKTALNKLAYYIPVMRMYTDDILACLKYGRDWGAGSSHADHLGELSSQIDQSPAGRLGLFARGPVLGRRRLSKSALFLPVHGPDCGHVFGDLPFAGHF